MAKKVSSAVLIREAVPEDLEQLVAIERASFADPWTKKHLSEDDRMVACVNGQVVAFLISRETCPASATEAAEYEILNVAVAPEWRRQGLATQLLERLFENRGVYYLEVRESNLPAQELYSRFGFQVVGKRPKYYRRPIESAIVMQMKRC